MVFNACPGRCRLHRCDGRGRLAKVGRFMSFHVPSSPRTRPLRVGVVALPASIMSPLIGLHEVFDVMRIYASEESAFPRELCFPTEIVAPTGEMRSLTSDLPLRVHRTIAGIDYTDIVIVPPKSLQGTAATCLYDKYRKLSLKWPSR